MRGAYAKRFSGDAPPVVALFSCFLIVLRGLRRVLVSAPEARSAEGDGRRQPPVSAAADLYQDKHTPCCHTRNFSVSKGYIRGYKMPRLYSRSQRLSALHIEQCSLPLSLTGKHCMIDAQKKGEAERLLPMRQTLIKSESLQR